MIDWNLDTIGYLCGLLMLAGSMVALMVIRCHRKRR